jgi:hypothetical protein
MAGRYTTPDQRRGVKDYGRDGRRRSVSGDVAASESPIQTEDDISLTDESDATLLTEV